MAIQEGLSDVIFDFQIPGGLTALRRTAQPKDEFGEDPDPIETPFTLEPIEVHPLVGAQRLQFLSGSESRESILIFVTQKLRTTLEGTDKIADILLYDADGEGVESRYVIQNAENWVQQCGHWRCIGLRLENQ